MIFFGEAGVQDGSVEDPAGWVELAGREARSCSSPDVLGGVVTGVEREGSAEYGEWCAHCTEPHAQWASPGLPSLVCWNLLAHVVFVCSHES